MIHIGQEIKIKNIQMVICDRCQGEGCIEVATGDADHCHLETCPQCGGMRVMKRVVTVEFLPIKKEANKS